MKKWSYNGVKRFAPSMDYSDWLKICARGLHFEKSIDEVLKNWGGKNG